ncbi:MAG TPA: SpvB/TcaC N-terminal domain-containing protein [Micromonosporaceae bacterium]|nr:SpvB/TcaC N-terminal domain-containing protein [Micromonosporaceae bacterium]
MGDARQAPTDVISLPKGGGAVRGLGEKFTPDPFTGTGTFTVPIDLPAGRGDLTPSLDLTYSTGQGNGVFGLGWSLSVPGVTRRTSHGTPWYDDERDTFILSGAEDLVPMDRPSATSVRYRPRTEGTFARIVHHRDPDGSDFWEVTGRDGTTSRYGTPRPAPATGATATGATATGATATGGMATDGTATGGMATGETWRDPAVLADPAAPDRIFAWRLTETRDPFGNVVRYEYRTDEGAGNGHRWRQPLLHRVAYADYDSGGQTRYLYTVSFDYEDRPDAFSSYRAGFEVRTTRRCRAVTASVHTGPERPVRRYELSYATDPYNGVSLLRAVTVVGFDDAGMPWSGMPPLTFTYSQFAPERRAFAGVHGPDLPPASLARDHYDLVDVTGDGLPDVIQLDGTARYWANLGGGAFDRPRPMRAAPAGLALRDPGVQLLDADGDGRPDLLVSRPGLAGYFPLEHDATWGRFRRYPQAPTFDLDDPQVRLVDLDGDGVTDALRAGVRLECFFSDPGRGWTGPVLTRQETPETPDGMPRLTLADPRVKLADLTGDGLSDLVLVHDGDVQYFPNLGRGRWGERLRMAASPRLPAGYDPRRVLLGDVDGDGLADLVYVAADHVTVWVNRGGGSWSPPVTISGTPGPGPNDSLRIADLHGTGTGGVLWSRDATPGRPSLFFLDLTGGDKPRLLTGMDNNIGAVTRVRYAPSSRFAVADGRRAATRWRTPLPVVVTVVAEVEVADAVSRTTLTTGYRYHHGYWDGVEREFRGFACVDVLDTLAFAGDVDPAAYCPPTLTRTWFHLGPVGPDDGDWAEPDFGADHWPGDPNLLGHQEQTNRFLRTLRDRRARRDALRVLRGRVLRTELYARDGSARQDRPYTVSEHAYGLRTVAGPGAAAPGRPAVFFAYPVAQRTTQWERGDDPMTRFSFTGDYDEYGQPRRHTEVALPRRSARRRTLTAAVVGQFAPDGTGVLATHRRTELAVPDPGVHLYDRVAQTRAYELRNPPGVVEPAPDDVRAVLAAQARAAQEVVETFDRLAPGDVALVEHTRHHYDGPAYTGLPVGQAGRYGATTRTESLVCTDELLDAVYGSQRPAYLGGPAPLPAGAPAGFGSALGYTRVPPSTVGSGAYYVDTLRQCHDFQDTTAASPPRRGAVVATQDALGRETRLTLDSYWLLPVAVEDPVGLRVTAAYNYRAGDPQRVVDPHGHATVYAFHPLGMLSAAHREGRDGEGDTAATPEVRHEYDFGAYPVFVHNTQRVRHASDGVSGEVLGSREYSDGFGRVVQTRAQAADLAFGDRGDGVGLLGPGSADGVATGTRATDRVVVSGWRRYDNKGQVVEAYEPFFGRGWAYQPEADARRGNPTSTRYDPRGHPVAVVNPDGSRRRMVYGLPADLADPERFEPTPWVVTTYDANDLAAGGRLASAVPATHHHTPATAVLDGLDRTVCQLVRNGTDPATDWYAARTRYDVRGNPVAVTDELGRVALRHHYDLLDRPIRVDSIDAGTQTSVLDALDGVVQTRDARGAMTLRRYDALHRITALWARDDAGAALTLRESIEYGDGGDPAQPAAARAAARTANRLGRVWRHRDGAGIQVFDAYDFRGNVREKSRQVVSDTALAAGWAPDWSAANAASALDPLVYRTSLRHDALDRVVELRTPAGAGPGVRTRIAPRYDRSGAVCAIDVDGRPYVRLIAYNARRQRVLVGYGNGTMTRYGYDPLSARLVRLRSERGTPTGDTWTASGPVLQELSYTYDAVGNVTAIEDRTPGCGVRGTAEGRDRLVRRFTYDPIYRLASATGRACGNIGRPRPFEDAPRCGSAGPPYRPGPATPNQANAPDLTELYTESYQYDHVGNLRELRYAAGTTWVRRYGLGNRPPQDWAQAASNRLTTVASGATTQQLGYDASGNLTAGGLNQQYAWDHADRLAEVRTSAGGPASVHARYLYGADGVRVKKWVRRGTGPARDESTVYVDGVFEHHRWRTAGGGENTVVHVLDGAARVAHVRTSGQAHPDDAGPPVRYQLADHLGSASVVVGEDGVWVNREELLPYGETAFGGFRRKRFRFTGAERDIESGLSYHGGRYYAPWLARWSSCDPSGTVDGLSLYAYARANPLLYTDPTGHAAATTPPPVKNPVPPQLTEGKTAETNLANLAGSKGKSFEGSQFVAQAGKGGSVIDFVKNKVTGTVESKLVNLSKYLDAKGNLDVAKLSRMFSKHIAQAQKHMNALRNMTGSRLDAFKQRFGSAPKGLETIVYQVKNATDAQVKAFRAQAHATLASAGGPRVGIGAIPKISLPSVGAVTSTLASGASSTLSAAKTLGGGVANALVPGLNEAKQFVNSVGGGSVTAAVSFTMTYLATTGKAALGAATATVSKAGAALVSPVGGAAGTVAGTVAAGVAAAGAVAWAVEDTRRALNGEKTMTDIAVDYWGSKGFTQTMKDFWYALSN